MALTDTAQLDHAFNNYYSRALLERAVPALVHAAFGQVRDIPKGNTNVIKFRRYGALTAATTPLTEGVTPTGSQLSYTDVTATVAQYGDYVTVSDFLVSTTPDPLMTETAEVLGEQAGETIDVIVRNIINAGTTVQYADVTAPKTNNSRDDVNSNDILATDELDIAIRTMKNNNAKKITSMVDPDTGYSTTPVNAAYVAIVHPNSSRTIQGLTGFESIEKYANRLSKPLPNEIGKYKDLRFIESTQAKFFDNEGASSIDVYSMLVLGMNAYGVTRISGEALRNIVKPLGSGGTSDPLEQRATSGWKATLAAVILNQSFLLRVEHAVA